MAATIQNEEGDLGFQIAPMVDVVFVLMLFFMTCIAFDPQYILQASFASEAQYPNTTRTAIEVTIDADNNVFVLNRPIAGPDDAQVLGLKQWLLDARQRFGTDDPVVISAAPVSYTHLTLPTKRIV